MKTVNFFLAAFVLSITLASCQKENIEPQSVSPDATGLKAGLPNPAVKGEPGSLTGQAIYKVTVTLPTDKSICNIYWVEMVDANGRFVAPPQTYIPGTSTYTFYEKFNQRSGIRAARLVLSPNADHFACPTELFTQPDVQVIQFNDRETYSFNLYPQAHAPKLAD